MILEPGMNVECIEGYGLVKTGEKYVIAQVFPAGIHVSIKRDMVSLVGIERPAERTKFAELVQKLMGMTAFAPTAFDARRFRPIKKTDISILQELTKVHELEDA